MEELLGLKQPVPLEKPRGFNPYMDNSGTIIGIAGEDFCVVGADTRLSMGYTILSRKCSKMTQLTSNCAIGSSGMRADIDTLHKMLLVSIKMYKHKFEKEPSTEGIAQMLSTRLYSRRFFPFYAFNLLCGIDQKGKGVVYGYDAIGSYEAMTYGTQGSGRELVTPVLDTQLEGHNTIKPKLIGDVNLAVDLIKDVMNSCAERDIHTGDGLDILLITKEGMMAHQHKLRAD